MKKGVWIWIIVAVVILIIAGVIAYSYMNVNKCAKVGEVSFDDATGKIIPCCRGLNAISPQSGKYEPTNKYADKDGCIWGVGFGSYCSNIICGNGICDSPTENRCTCPEDCLNNSDNKSQCVKDSDCKIDICGQNSCVNINYQTPQGVACAFPPSMRADYCKCENNSCKGHNSTIDSVCGNGICEPGEGIICPNCPKMGGACGACWLGTCPEDCLTNESICNSFNGKWVNSPSSPGRIFYCNLPTKDSGKICNDNKDCLTFCKAKNGAIVGTKGTGTCNQWKIYQDDCSNRIINGTVAPGVCA